MPKDLDWSDVEADALNDPNRVETITNNITRREVAIEDAVEETKGRWFIKMGFPGFNSTTNNLFGYASKNGALRAVRRYNNF